jgi:uncharacterized protein YpiB (UPF0302 family)
MTAKPLDRSWLECALCGLRDIECLEFHHISRSPEELVVLCANHHTKIHRNSEFAAKAIPVLIKKAFARTLLDNLKKKILRKAGEGINCQDLEDFLLLVQK